MINVFPNDLKDQTLQAVLPEKEDATSIQSRWQSNDNDDNPMYKDKMTIG